MHHPTDRIVHTTAFGALAGTRNSAMGPPMKDRSDDPSHHERTLLPRSYISLTFMEECRHRYCSHFLQEADIQSPWYLAFRCMLLQDKELSRQQFSSGKVRSASSKQIVIPANTEMILKG